MRTSTVIGCLLASLAAAQISLAQRSPDAPGVAVAAVSDAELETFATIYVDLLETVATFDAELKAAQTQEQALEVRGRMQTESIAKVARHGWTPEKFNSVSEAIDNDATLTQKAATLIEQR